MASQCSSCGQEVSPGAAVCAACGAILAAGAATVALPVAATASQAAIPAPTPSPTAGPATTPPPAQVTPAPGADQPGAPLPGSAAGPPPAGYPQPGYPQAGYPSAGYPQPGYPQPGYAPGYPQPGYAPGYPHGGYPQPGYPPQGYGPAYGGYAAGYGWDAQIYRYGDALHTLTPEQRAHMGAHQLGEFPVAVVVLLHYLTLGIFTMIYFGLHHGKLPLIARDDPSAGKAIGFLFIPGFNLYWIFVFWLRLCDRLNLQYQLRGHAPRAPRGLATASCVIQVIPYINFLVGWPIMMPILAGMVQSRVNELARLGPQLPTG